MEKLVSDLIKNKYLKSERLIEAFKKIDRKDFVLPEYAGEAYFDYPLPIGFNQTISQPSTVAFMLELLQPQAGEKILDIGSGSGWTTALLAEIAGKNGYVHGVEIIPGLVKFGKNNLKKYAFRNVKILQAGKSLGLPEKAPYDKILVSAAGEKVPDELLAQLKIKGVLVIPIKNDVWKIKKISSEETNKEKYEGFVFVPLK